MSGPYGTAHPRHSSRASRAFLDFGPGEVRYGECHGLTT